MLRLLSSAVVHAVLLGTACAPPASLVDDAPLEGPFDVVDGHIVDAHGGRLILRGTNLSQTAKSAPFHPVETADDEGRARLAAHGPVALRYLTSWAAIEPEQGVMDQPYLDALSAHVGALAADGHLVVLDLHQDLFGVGFPGGNGAPLHGCDDEAYAAFTYEEPWFLNYQDPEMKRCFDALFGDEDKLRRMARALRTAVDAVQAAAPRALVGVDLINEPHPGSRGNLEFDALLARYYEIAAEELAGTGLVLLFEPNVTHNFGEPTTFTAPPAGAAAFAPHLYPVDAELGRYDDLPALAGVLAHDADEARALGVPLVIGEYGPKLDDPNAVLFVEDVLGILDESFTAAFSWDWSAVSDRGLLREGADDVRRAELRPHARRIAGEPSAHRFDPRTATLEVEWAPFDAIGATEIVSGGWGTPVVEGIEGAEATLDDTGILRVRALADHDGERRVIVRFE